MKKSCNHLVNAVFCMLFFYSLPSLAANGTWSSTTTGSSITYTITDPVSPVKDYAGGYVTVVYLENLAFIKLGQNSNATDVAWLLSKGYRVIELNYAKNGNAISPNINADIKAINTAINAGSFCGLSTCSKYKSYILFEGYRINRDVSYFKDDPTVYNVDTHYTVGDSLHLDIIYPANTSAAVPIVLSFSYSNSYPNYDSSSGTLTDVYKDQRMNLGNTLAGFNDSFLEGAPALGIAWAIADHPKYCNWGQGKPVGGANKTYASYETNPDAAQKVKSAIRTLRALGANHGLSGKIGIYGFSRGSTAGSLAVGDRTVANFENAGRFIGVSDDVQVAALGSGVFDYTKIYDPAESDIGTLLTNCPLAWGPLASNTALWDSQGAAYLAETSASAPVIFFYNTTDASYYQHQIAQFKAKLTTLNVPTTSVVDYGTGHAVPQTSATLNTVYNFMKQYLTPPSITTAISETRISDASALQLTLAPNQVTNTLQLSIFVPRAADVEIEFCSMSGVALSKMSKIYSEQGWHRESIPVNMPQGVYIAKISSEGKQVVKRFIKE